VYGDAGEEDGVDERGDIDDVIDSARREAARPW
jgi:hypothetical protein